MSAPLPEAVSMVFNGFPPAAREGCMALRDLILDVAGETPGVGAVSEELRWRQPAYLTRAGTTIRLGVPKSGGYALFVPCQTMLIEDFRPLAPAGTRFDGWRAVLFRGEEVPDK